MKIEPGTIVINGEILTENEVAKRLGKQVAKYLLIKVAITYGIIKVAQSIRK